ncbi:MAG: hypothetical protein ACJAYU_003851 [Bradymonadia bacterium]|jgi:hypothetical protein
MNRILSITILTLTLAGCGDTNESASADTGNDTPMGTEPDAAEFEIGDTDMVAYACTETGWAAGECLAGVVVETTGESGNHVDEPTLITYETTPPTAGPHRGAWGVWGEYEFMPPQRYIHNLEHGGIAFLYNPCLGDEVLDQLREFARAWPADDGGEFRWILTPYPELETAISVVSWGQAYTADCVDTDEISAFIADNYRTAPEDVARDGSYDRLSVGR